MHLTIATQDTGIYTIFRRMFEDEVDVDIYHGSAFDIEADAIVSPANSFGYMDGGFDAQITEYFGTSIQSRVRKAIEDKHYGELNIGSCIEIPIQDKVYGSLYVTPTMRVPMDVHLTNNAYVAFRSMLVQSIFDNASSVVTPVLCTGVGKMDPYVAATQMKMAYRNIIGGQRYNSFELAHMSQIKMLSPDFTY